MTFSIVSLLIAASLVACGEDEPTPASEPSVPIGGATMTAPVTSASAGGGMPDPAASAVPGQAIAGTGAAAASDADLGASAGEQQPVPAPDEQPAANDEQPAAGAEPAETDTPGEGTDEPAGPNEGTDGPPEAGNGGAPGEDVSDLENFSFFVTSLDVMQELAGSPDGFGGDFGGLEGADSICQRAAERVEFGAKQWRAFLSVTDGGDGQPVHAIDRIGEGPWYDRNGRLLAEDIAGLLQERPAGDSQTVNDLPNEFGEGLKSMGDTHDVVTGTNAQGQLATMDPAGTCNDWTSTTVSPVPAEAGGGGGGRGGRRGGVQLGHSWPARSGNSWTTVHTARSCGAGVNLEQNGGGDGSSIGAGGGWGAIYCFALTP